MSIYFVAGTLESWEKTITMPANTLFEHEEPTTLEETVQLRDDAANELASYAKFPVGHVMLTALSKVADSAAQEAMAEEFKESTEKAQMSEFRDSGAKAEESDEN